MAPSLDSKTEHYITTVAHHGTVAGFKDRALYYHSCSSCHRRWIQRLSTILPQLLIMPPSLDSKTEHYITTVAHHATITGFKDRALYYHSCSSCHRRWIQRLSTILPQLLIMPPSLDSKTEHYITTVAHHATVTGFKDRALYYHSCSSCHRHWIQRPSTILPQLLIMPPSLDSKTEHYITTVAHHASRSLQHRAMERPENVTSSR